MTPQRKEVLACFKDRQKSLENSAANFIMQVIVMFVAGMDVTLAPAVSVYLEWWVAHWVGTADARRFTPWNANLSSLCLSLQHSFIRS